MRIAVIGATGFIGATLCVELAASGHEVLAWGRRKPKGWRQWADALAAFHCADVTRVSTLDSILEAQPEALVYCVSLDHHTSESLDASQVVETNVLPVWRLLSAAADRGLAQKFVYLSTAHVYGSLSGTIDEHSAADPRNNYALTHLMAELLTARYGHGQVKTINVRLANGYGAPVFDDANCWWLVINDFCRMAIHEGHIQLRSDGSPLRDFVHLRDIAGALRLLLESPANALEHDLYNLGGGHTYSMLELAHHVARLGEQRYGAVRVVMPDGTQSEDASAHADLERFHYSTGRLRRLGFVPTMDLDEGIGHLFDYLEAVATPGDASETSATMNHSKR